MSLLYAASVRENVLFHARSYRLTVYMSLLHAARVRENVLLHDRSYRLTAYSSENGHHCLAVCFYCMLHTYVRTCCYMLGVIA